MNHQSDYGYTVGGVEHRDFAVCVTRAKECRRFAFQYPNKADYFRRMAREWIKEARYYRCARPAL